MTNKIIQLATYLPFNVELKVDKIYTGFKCPLVISNPTNSFKNGMTISSAIDHEAEIILKPFDIIFTKNEEGKYSLLEDLIKIEFPNFEKINTIVEPTTTNFKYLVDFKASNSYFILEIGFSKFGGLQMDIINSKGDLIHMLARRAMINFMLSKHIDCIFGISNK